MRERIVFQKSGVGYSRSAQLCMMINDVAIVYKIKPTKVMTKGRKKNVIAEEQERLGPRVNCVPACKVCKKECEKEKERERAYRIVKIDCASDFRNANATASS